MSLSVITRGKLILALATVLIMGAATAQNFGLFNNCETMGLSIGYPMNNDVAEEMGLTRESIENLVEIRLRAARLYDDELGGPYLYVIVFVVGSAFNIDVEYKRWVRVVDTGAEGIAPTWDTGSVGTHARDPKFILGTLSGLIDDFLLAYLRVNEESC